MSIINKKVRNATPIEIDGIKFKSKLEGYVYKKLKEYNIFAEYEPIKFILIPSFYFLGKKIRPITYTPDFVGNNFIIEAKGRPNETFPLKWKLFLYKLYYENLTNKYQLFIVHNHKEVDECINKILNLK